MHPNAAHQQLLQFWTGALRPVVFIQPSGKLFLLVGQNALLAFKHFANGPTLFAIKTEQQRRRVANGFVAGDHAFDKIAKQFVFDPVEYERNFAVGRLYEL